MKVLTKLFQSKVASLVFLKNATITSALKYIFTQARCLITGRNEKQEKNALDVATFFSILSNSWNTYSANLMTVETVIHVVSCVEDMLELQWVYSDIFACLIIADPTIL